MTPWIHTRTHDSGRESLYVYWKEKVEGSDGKQRWELQRIHVKDNNRKTAGRIRDKIATEIAERGWLVRPRRSTWTFGELRDVYLDRMKHERPRSQGFRRERAAHLVRILGEATNLEEITRERVAEYARRRLAEKWKRSKDPEAKGFPTSAATVNRELSILRHMMRLAAEEWIVETGLSEFRLGAVKPLSTKGRERNAVFLSPEQRAAVLEAASAIARKRGTTNAREGELAVQLALTTGARVGEILATRWEDLRGDRWVVRTEKGGRDRAVALGPDVLEALRAIGNGRKREGLVFSLPPRTAPRDAFRSFWNAVRKKAKVRCRFHDLRHTFASVAAAGRPLRDVQTALGHTSIRTTEKYAKFSKDLPPAPALSLKDLVPAVVPAAGMTARKRDQAKRAKGNVSSLTQGKGGRRIKHSHHDQGTAKCGAFFTRLLC